jgi:hypothetical protein
MVVLEVVPLHLEEFLVEQLVPPIQLVRGLLVVLLMALDTQVVVVVVLVQLA